MQEQAAAGAATADICRKHGISTRRSTKRKAKYGGPEVDAKRLKALKDENAKLTKLLAEAMLDNAMLRDVAAKNGDACRAPPEENSELLCATIRRHGLTGTSEHATLHDLVVRASPVIENG